MNITWVNHASYVMNYDGVSLITDPWTEGTAFNNGWSLICKTVFSYEDYKNITHIWFSHEHPDHFSPPNLKKIPAEYKKNITVLYQETIDNKVAAYCAKAGFKEVIPMQSGKFYNLTPKFSVMCSPFTEGDSWLYAKTDKIRVLNVNDCILYEKADAEKIKDTTGDVDVLLTQFSYANWAGNKDDTETAKKYAREKFVRIKMQAEVFNPKQIIPFASFVWFCHEDNFYLNKGINDIDSTYAFITNELKRDCVVLYPGDQWQAGTLHNSTLALEKYRIDYASALNGKPLFFNKTVSTDELLKKGNAYLKLLLDKNKTIGLKLFEPSKIYVTDLDKTFSISFKSGFREEKFNHDDCDISLASPHLEYVFETLWGGDTLSVNGCFQVPKNGNYQRFRMYSQVASMNNRGEVYPDLITRTVNKLKRMLG